MAIKLFLDTNIFIDLIDKTRINHEYAVALFVSTINSRTEIFCSESIITTTYYILQKSFTASTLQKILIEILVAVTVLPCTNGIVETAINTNSVDLEDVILYQIALQNNMDYFVTNDKQALKKLQKGNLEVLNCKDLLKRLK
jgi:predicted nucleic acid-binding protein